MILQVFYDYFNNVFVVCDNLIIATGDKNNVSINVMERRYGEMKEFEAYFSTPKHECINCILGSRKTPNFF